MGQHELRFFDGFGSVHCLREEVCSRLESCGLRAAHVLVEAGIGGQAPLGVPAVSYAHESEIDAVCSYRIPIYEALMIGDVDANLGFQRPSRTIRQAVAGTFKLLQS